MRFAGEGLDHPRPGQVLLQHGVQRRQVLLHAREHGPHAAAEDAKQQQRNGHDGQDQQRQPPVHGEEHRQAAEEHHHGVEHLQEAHAGEAAHHFHVAGGAGHELAGLRPVVVAEGEALDLGVKGIAQVIGHALRGFLREVALQKSEERAHQRHADEGQGHDDNGAHIPGTDAAVNEQLQQPGTDQAGAGGQQQAGVGPQRGQPMFSQVSQHFAQWFHGLGYSFQCFCALSNISSIVCPS